MIRSPLVALSLVLSLFCLAVSGAPRPAFAQALAGVFLQVEAHPTLQRGQEAAESFAADLAGVSGHRVPGGWYAVTLGPFDSREAAAAELRSLRSVGAIPDDSFIVDADRLGQRFYPVGAAALAIPQAPAPAPAPAPLAILEEPEETIAQARIAEGALSAAQRRELQEALQWNGYYRSAIDGAFGAGTRRAMGDWQADRGFDATGILTTRQRALLLREFYAQFESLGLQMVTDAQAGIELLLPLAQVARDAVDPPFVRYAPIGGGEMQALLISQSGDQGTLFGLYDIMQSLEIVPAEGERVRGPTSFTLTGQDQRRSSYTYAVLTDGTVKGFTLVWPRSEDAVMERIVERIRGSFTPLDEAVLPEVAGSGQVQSADLIAGLEIRRPVKSRAALWVDGQGRAVTTTDLLDPACGRYTLAEDFVADVIARDDRLGLALLEPRSPLAPPAVASLRDAPLRLRSEIAVAGYPFEGRLGLPSVTFGQLEELQGLQGEPDIARLKIATRDGDAGGPLLDMGGAVAGLLQAQPGGSRTLPADVRFAVSAPALAAFLTGAGVDLRPAAPGATMAPEDMTRMAADTVVLASCWE